MKKIYVILLGIMLVLIGCSSIVLAGDEQEDQTQEDYTDSCVVYRQPAGCYQSFIPNLPKLTKISVLLEKPGGAQTTCERYYLAVKKGGASTQTLTSISIEGTGTITSTTPVWYEFDFPDIDVEKGSTYGIQMYGTGSNIAAAAVRWCYADHDVYGYGVASADDDGDGSYTSLGGDFAFKTFGMDKKSKDYGTPLNPFIQFLENHPNLFPLLRQVLGL